MVGIMTPLDFIDAGCELATPLPIFLAIYSLSNGNPCKGCAYDMDGKCAARKALFKMENKRPQLQESEETVRAMAARLGISLSEARRKRRHA